MFYVLMFEFMLLGVIGGLLGIFYRNSASIVALLDNHAHSHTLLDKLGFTP